MKATIHFPRLIFYFFLFVFSFSLISKTYSQAAKQIISGKIEVEDDNVAGTVLVVEKNNAPYKKFTIKDDGKFNVTITYQAEFLLSFEKKGYVTKKIAISTKLPPGILDEGYDPINFVMSLFKQYEGMNTVVFNQPVAKYKYDAKTDGFIFDTDYTKSIQSEIAKVEAVIEVKKKEEKEQKKNPSTADNKVTQQTNNNTDKNNTTKLNTGTGNDNRKTAEVTVGNENNNNSDSKNKAKGKEDEEWKKKLKANSQFNPKSDEEAAKLKAKQKEEDEKRKQQIESKQKNDALAKGKLDEENKRKAKEKLEEDVKKLRDAKASSDEANRKLAEAKSKAEEEQRKLLGSAKMKSYLAKIYPIGITIEIKKDKWKETKRIIVNRDSLANEYVEVIHSWGGKYYFRNNEAISPSIFGKETKPIGTEPVYTKQD